MIRKRNSYIFIFLVIISLLSFTPDVIASNHNYEISSNIRNEQKWYCYVCDKVKMNALFGANWDNIGLFENISQGSKMKWQIADSGARYGVPTPELWTLWAEIYVWTWNNEPGWSSPVYYFELTYLDDPSQYPSNYNLSNVIPFVPLLLPVPIGEYIGALELSNIYDIDNRVLPTINIEISKGFLQPNYPSERVSIIAIYNTDGILSNLKMYTSENVVLIDISLLSIPIYVLPATLGLIGVFIIAIVLYIRKQEKERVPHNLKGGSPI